MPMATTETVLISKEPDATEEWINYIIPKIKQQESGGNPTIRNWADAKITGEPSIGCFQYQPKTWNLVLEKYNLAPNAEKTEYMNLIEDCDFQELVTRTVFRNEPNAWLHWKTTFLTLKLPKSLKEM